MKKNLFLLIFGLFITSSVLMAQSTLDMAEDFSMKSTTGITHSLFPYLDDGKIVVLTFFTTT